MNIIETRVRGFIEDIQHPQQKKKININDLEWQLRQQLDDYFEIDGYHFFYTVIQQLEEEGHLSPIQNKQHNGRTPVLPLFYWVNVKKETMQWDRLEMMKRNDLFDFSYYERHPEWQTIDEWKRIEKLYDFLKEASERVIVSLAERSLELFGHEKFLTDEKEFPEGKGFLSRIGVTLEQLKVQNLGEPFVFWLKQGKEMKDIKRILIVENLSFFYTCVKKLESEQLDYEPELIIYGAGKQIESSFSFLFLLFPEKPYLFYYAGDLDAEGYSILGRLTNRYSDCSIQPALKIYRKMLEYVHQANEQPKKQVKDRNHRDAFLAWFTEEEQKTLLTLWEEEKRIPQEVLTIETWK